MTTVFDLTLMLADKVSNLRRGTSNSGSTSTTLTDPRETFANGDIGGTVWILDDQLKAARRISAVSTNTITFSTLTAGTAGIFARPLSYAVADKDFTLIEYLAAVNEALRKFNPRIEKTVLTARQDKTSYVLPSGVRNITKVEIVREEGGKPRTTDHWDEVQSALIFSKGYEPETGTIRLTYRAAHQEMKLTETVPATVDEELTLWAATANLARLGLRRFANDEKRGMMNLFNEAQAELTRLKPNFNEPQRSPRPADW